MGARTDQVNAQVAALQTGNQCRAVLAVAARQLQAAREGIENLGLTAWVLADTKGATGLIDDAAARVSGLLAELPASDDALNRSLRSRSVLAASDAAQALEYVQEITNDDYLSPLLTEIGAAMGRIVVGAVNAAGNLAGAAAGGILSETWLYLAAAAAVYFLIVRRAT